MRSRPLSMTSPRAPTPARGCKARPISPARWRDWPSAAAARAISPPSATASSPPPSWRARSMPSRKRRPKSPKRCNACRRPDGMLAAELSAALAAELPALKRDGGFVREGYDAALDETRALARRIPPRHRQPAGALCRRDRRARAQDPPQQRARLFRRGHRAARRQADVAAAQRQLHPPPDAGRPGALHHHRAGRTGSQDRQRGGALARAGAGNLRAAHRRGDRRHRGAEGLRRGARPARRRQRARRARRRARLCPPARGRQPRLRHRRRPPRRGRAGAGARRHAVRRQRLRSGAAQGDATPAASG